MDPDKTTSTTVSAPADFDLGAINEAVAESSAHPAPADDIASSNKALTMDDIADDSKFNDTGVDNDGDAISAVPVNPTAKPVLNEPAAPAEKPAEPEAAFISGDIVDEKPEDEEESEPAAPNPYENIGRDPLAEDASATPATAATATATEGAAPADKPAEPEKPLEPVSLDNAITTTGPAAKKGKTGLIIGIVAGVVVIGVVVALFFILGKK